MLAAIASRKEAEVDDEDNGTKAEDTVPTPKAPLDPRSALLASIQARKKG